MTRQLSSLGILVSTIYGEWQLFKRTETAQQIIGRIPLISFMFYRLAWWAESARRAVAARLSVIVPAVALLAIIAAGVLS